MKVFLKFFFAAVIIAPSQLFGLSPGPCKAKNLNPPAGSELSGRIKLTTTIDNGFGSCRASDYSCTYTMTGGLLNKRYDSADGTFETNYMEPGVYTAVASCGFAQGAAASYNVVKETRPPAVSVTNLFENQEVFGQITVLSAANDDEGGQSGIRRVQFFAEGIEFGVDSEAPYEASFDTRNVANGPMLLTVRAIDGADNAGTVSIVLNVNNPDAPIATPRPPGQPTFSPEPPQPIATSTAISTTNDERIFKVTIIDRKTREGISAATVTFVTENGNKKVDADANGVAQAAFKRGSRIAASIKASRYTETSTKVFKLNQNESVTVKMARREPRRGKRR